MSASIHRRTCSQLGVCQARPEYAECGYPKGECQEADGSGSFCTRLHRTVHTEAARPRVYVHLPRNTRADWLWHVAAPVGVCTVLLVAHIVATW